MALPSWINQVCPSPPEHLTWHQPAEVRSRDRRYAVRTITAPRWRYLAMPMRNFDAPCWRLEDAAEVRP